MSRKFLQPEIEKPVLRDEADSPVKIDSLLEMLGNNNDAVKSCLEEFIESSAQSRREIKSAIENKDAKALQDSAHRIKGSLIYLSAVKAVVFTAELEEMGRKGDLVGAEKLYSALEVEYSRIMIDLGEQVY